VLGNGLGRAMVNGITWKMNGLTPAVEYRSECCAGGWKPQLVPIR
jgi:hypothetical protein